MQGIKFNQDGITAILEGRKTMTRRPIKFKDGFCNSDKFVMYALDHIEKSKRGAIHREIYDKELGLTKFTGEIIYPKYKIGETVFVQEEFCIDNLGALLYRENDFNFKTIWNDASEMQGYQARIFLKITNIKAEYLQDISEEDCIKEGMEKEEEGLDIFNMWFRHDIWNKLPYKAPYDWSSNPYVFVYEFERIENV